VNDADIRVTIVGGGVAALEAMIALRHLAEERVRLELVAPKPEFAYRPLAVAEPFGLGESRRYDLGSIAAEHVAALQLAGIAAVEPDRRRIVTWDGRRLDFEVLLLAIGALRHVDPRQRDDRGARLHQPIPDRPAGPGGAADTARRVRRSTRHVMAAAALRAGADDRGAGRRTRAQEG
jgi:NADPH-dependent 2,4-dienoyl-CoA reductase/sulfur reductase-like enzyme